MGVVSERGLGPMSIADRWLRAGIWASVRVRATGLDQVSDKPAAVGPMFVMLARAQYGAKASLDRLLDAHAFSRLQDEETASFAEKMINTFEVLHQAHNFLVAVDLFWETIKRLDEHLDLQEFTEVFESSKNARRTSRDARNHIEHIAERIAEGRKNAPMTPQEFRSKMGIFDGTKIWFGPESYNVIEMHEAVHRAGQNLAPLLEES